ncbi:hypothetical protein PINS_up012526 [Pythium insidiosum]|nr:hypothetical protein PINS_up012526 [Pythium insidiosum]
MVSSISRRRSSSRERWAQLLQQQLSTRSCLAIAVAIVVCQWLCAAYLFLLANVYWYIDLPDMTYYANLLALPTTRRLTFWGHAHLSVAVLHVVDTVVLLLSCVVRNRVSRVSRQRTAPEPVEWRAPEAPDRSTNASLIRRVQRGVHRIWTAFVSAGSAVFGQHGLLGIESTLFDVVFSARELVEMTAQCIQLHKYSALLSRPWINDIMVVMFVLDCWDSLVLSWLLRDREALRRVAALTVDTAMTIGTNVVIPAVILIPYIVEFDIEMFTFPARRLYIDELFMAMITENRSVIALSTVDGLSKIIPHLSIFTSLTSIRQFLLATVKKFYSERRQTGPPDCKPKGPSFGGSPVAVKRQKTGYIDRGIGQGVCCRRIFVRASHCISFLVGLAVLIVHIRARFDRVIPEINCKMPQYPWFSSGASCAIVEFNCFRQHRLLDKLSLSMLNPKAVFAVIFSHCPSLVVPSGLQDLTELLTMEIFNSTIVSWSRDAAITATIHTQFAYLGLIRVNMTALPDGVLHSELPPSFLDIEISISNLTALPPDLASIWHDMDAVYVEYSPISVFPSVVLELNPYALSLVGNQIHELPPIAFSTIAHPLVRFTLAENPLRELSHIANTSINVLALDGTQIAELPTWIHSEVSQRVYMWGTPYCIAAGAGEVASDSQPAIICQRFDGNAPVGGRYPHDIMKPYRIP